MVPLIVLGIVVVSVVVVVVGKSKVIVKKEHPLKNVPNNKITSSTSSFFKIITSTYNIRLLYIILLEKVIH